MIWYIPSDDWKNTIHCFLLCLLCYIIHYLLSSDCTLATWALAPCTPHHGNIANTVKLEKYPYQGEEGIQHKKLTQTIGRAQPQLRLWYGCGLDINIRQRAENQKICCPEFWINWRLLVTFGVWLRRHSYNRCYCQKTITQLSSPLPVCMFLCHGFCVV